MDIFNINSIEDLKSIGNINYVRKEIKNILGSNINIKFNSWQNIYNSLMDLKKIIQCFQPKTYINSNISDDLYFKGEAEKYIFILLELDGKQRLDKLKINKTHFNKKTTANEWRNSMAKIIHPDVCNHPQAEQAMAEVNALYKEMIK